MRSVLEPIVTLGEWALPAVWLPVLAWTVAALVAEAVLRLWPGHHPVVGLGVRRAMFWALPASVLAALVVPGMLPEATVDQVLAIRPEAFALPAIQVGVAPEAETLAPAPIPLAPLLAGLGLALAAGVGAVRLAGVGVGLARLRRLSSGATDRAVQDATDRAARAAGVSRKVRSVSTDVPTVPFTFGWRHPIVVVPLGLADDAASLRLVLAHEVAHVARGDFAAGIAERVVGAVFGWHPLVGTLSRRIDLDRERATDAAVLAQHPDRRRDYASLLLSFSRLPSPALALGAARGSRSLTTRITTMNASPLSARRLRQIGYATRVVGAALFLLAVGAASFVAVAQSPTRAPAVISEPDSTLIGDVSGGTLIADADGVRVEDDIVGVGVASNTLEDVSGAADIAEAARATIEGRVLDAATGEPIVAANVFAVRERKGAATDADGRFTLDGVDAGAELMVGAAGYFPKSVTAQADPNFVIRLDPETEQMREQRERMMEEIRRQEEEVRDLDPNSPDAPEIFEVVEEAPRLIGGLAGLQRAVVYPAEAKEAGVEGKVFVQFVVDEEGAVQDARCVRTPSESLCDASIAAVKAATFEPGRQRGQAVKVRFVLPVDFRLPRDDE